MGQPNPTTATEANTATQTDEQLSKCTSDGECCQTPEATTTVVEAETTETS